MFREELKSILYNLSQKREEEGTCPNSFSKASITTKTKTKERHKYKHENP